MITRRNFNKYATLASLGLAINSGMIYAGSGRSKIKVGQIGTGHSHAKSKYETLCKLEKIFDVVGIVENNPALKRKAQSEEAYSDANWIQEQQLIDTPGLQAILIETDFPDLLPTAKRCIKRGFHVHIDKPPGNSLEEFKHLLDNADKEKLVVQTGYMFRYHPAFEFCIRLVNQGMIGDVFEVHGVISKKIKSERRVKIASTYGGAMMLLGCHLIDILIAICGKPQTVTSYRRQTLSHLDQLYDNEFCVFEYLKITAGIRSALVEVEGSRRRQFIVCGTKGTIEIQPLEPARLMLTLEEDFGAYKKGLHEIKLPKLPGRYDAQLADFAGQIHGTNERKFSRKHELIVHESLLLAAGIM